MSKKLRDRVEDLWAADPEVFRYVLLIGASLGLLLAGLVITVIG